MSQRVISNLNWDLSWPSENVRNIRADYSYVPDTSDLAAKADLSFVNQKLSFIESSLKAKMSAFEQKTEMSLKSMNDSVQKALSSKDRIDSEKKELTQLFDVLSSNIKEECQKIESQLSSEIRAYQDVDKSLNDKLSKLISQKNDFVNAKNNASTILQELKRQITLADETVKNIKGNPNVVVHNFTQKVESMSYITYFLLANVILADIYLLYIWFSH